MATQTPTMINFDSPSEFFTQLILSEATLPFINFLKHSNPEDSFETLADNLRATTAGVGKDQKPIPDESEQLENVLLTLIKDGVPKPEGKPKVTIVGAGVSGLCAGYELKKAGYEVQILEASSRVGGRVKTFREPTFAPGLHGEGGAMRIPANHFLLHKYIQEFGLASQLFPFEMKNKFVYLSSYGKEGKRALLMDGFKVPWRQAYDVASRYQSQCRASHLRC